MTFLEFIATAFFSDYMASKHEEQRDVEELERLRQEIDELQDEILML